MVLISWQPQLSVNVSRFDTQHKELISLINELHDAMLSGKTRDIIADVLLRLTDYTITHFADEENLMLEHNYPQYKTHKLAHENLVAKVKETIQKYEAGLPINVEVMHFLKDWLKNHIMGEDKAYSSFFNSFGVK